MKGGKGVGASTFPWCLDLNIGRKEKYSCQENVPAKNKKITKKESRLAKNTKALNCVDPMHGCCEAQSYGCPIFHYMAVTLCR